MKHLFFLLLLLCVPVVYGTSIGVSPQRIDLPSTEATTVMLLITNPNLEILHYEITSDPQGMVVAEPLTGVLESMSSVQVAVSLFYHESDRNLSYLQVKSLPQGEGTALSVGAAIPVHFSLREQRVSTTQLASSIEKVIPKISETVIPRDAVPQSNLVTGDPALLSTILLLIVPLVLTVVVWWMMRER
ncbi:hypothetical protein HZB02_07235 [Candidatus Woesearchaeota archaeon]|nr:hypothetical protein [Candidatus Woesearchaeota archaeon]